jgi:tripartite-type tricarboxylate transporter receptor subunit TctC
MCNERRVLWRQRVLQVLSACALAGSLASAVAQAETYPAKQVLFITPGAPGSTADIMPRVIAEELSARLGKPVVVENKSGGSGLISASAALGQAPDGHTLWLGTMGTLTINPYVLNTMPFDSLKAWTPVALVASMPLVLVVNSEKTPVKDVAGLVALAKQQPGKLTFGSAGIGSSYAITMFVLGKQTGATFTHVPYKGPPAAVSDVLAGELTMMVPDVGLVKSQVDSGKLRALAVTSAQRSELLPNVPTFKEQGYDIEMPLWYGVFVRSETPQPIVRRLTDELRAVIQGPKIKARWDTLGLQVGDRFGDDFATYYRAEYKRWGELLPPLGIKAE